AAGGGVDLVGQSGADHRARFDRVNGRLAIDDHAGNGGSALRHKRHVLGVAARGHRQTPFLGPVAWRLGANGVRSRRIVVIQQQGSTGVVTAGVTTGRAADVEAVTERQTDTRYRIVRGGDTPVGIVVVWIGNADAHVAADGALQLRHQLDAVERNRRT